MQKDGRKENLIDRAAELLDLPGDIVAGMARITVTGCRRVFIESHRGVLEYGTREIHVNGGRVLIRIRGQDLKIRAMNSSDLLITGTVEGMDFTL